MGAFLYGDTLPLNEVLKKRAARSRKMLGARGNLGNDPHCPFYIKLVKTRLND